MLTFVCVHNIVRLKRFPAHKSWWQTLQEASQRGDAIEVSELADHVKLGMARLMLRVIAGSIESELDELGLGSLRGRGGGVAGSSGVGLGPTQRKGWMRAEWGGLNLR